MQKSNDILSEKKGRLPTELAKLHQADCGDRSIRLSRVTDKLQSVYLADFGLTGRDEQLLSREAVVCIYSFSKAADRSSS